jgi:hypothetical protein
MKLSYIIGPIRVRKFYNLKNNMIMFMRCRVEESLAHTHTLKRVHPFTYLLYQPWRLGHVCNPLVHFTSPYNFTIIHRVLIFFYLNRDRVCVWFFET